mmetsp:Transcript_16727/g.26327  ORF Transcript_16727/g.26327 Transcript_16727/m.26327 type:complete len:691 (-) Transcript_16727:171-2243(-)
MMDTSNIDIEGSIPPHSSVVSYGAVEGGCSNQQETLKESLREKSKAKVWVGAFLLCSAALLVYVNSKTGFVSHTSALSEASSETNAQTPEAYDIDVDQNPKPTWDLQNLKEISQARASERVVMEADVDAAEVHSRAAAAGQWEDAGRAPADRALELVVGLRLRNADALERLFYEVSDPSGPRYGRHPSLRELRELTAPAPEAVALVRAFLAGHGIETEAEEQGGFLRASGPVTVAQAEAALGAEYRLLRHAATGRTIARCLGYSLPADVAAAVDFVGPTLRVPNTAYAAKEAGAEYAAAAAAAEGGYYDGLNYRGEDGELLVHSGGDHPYVTPSSLKALYGVGAVTGGAAGNNSLAVTAFLDEYFSESDLELFWEEYSPLTSGTEVSVSGPNDESDPGGEASLDIQYASAMATGVPISFWSFPGTSLDHNGENEPFLNFMMKLNSEENPPLVVSTSYGEDEGSTSLGYAKRLNQEFMKAGARGVTLIFASGDSGVGSTWDFDCSEEFIGQWPAASPYVTSVGSTAHHDPEIAAYFSSGGFSKRWPRPAYQEATVQAYLDHSAEMLTSETYKHRFAVQGRAFPDLSAQGWRYAVKEDGRTLGVYGTSCSAPTVAGLVALANDARLAAGKAPLGFLNQLIYQRGRDLFTDVQQGHNPGCSSRGFAAVADWDPVTGWGTPDLMKLRSVALELP